LICLNDPHGTRRFRPPLIQRNLPPTENTMLVADLWRPVMTPEDFRLRYSGEIREALIMLEGEDGSFELLTQGHLQRGDRSAPLCRGPQHRQQPHPYSGR
jgi:hypothetical protein